MVKKAKTKYLKLAFCGLVSIVTAALIFETPSLNMKQLDASEQPETSFSLNDDEYTELSKQIMSSSVSSSTRTSLGQSIQYSFATGYSSFSCSLISTSIELGPDLTGPSGAEFQKFYYDGGDGKKAFSQMDTLDLENRTKELKADPSDGVDVYSAFIRSVQYTGTLSSQYANKVFIPRVAYRTDSGVPYKTDAERRDMTDEEICTPVLTLNGDNIYSMDSVVYFGLTPNEISSQALAYENSGKISEIIIPDNITVLHEDSFVYTTIIDNVLVEVKPADNCVFKMEMSKEEIDELIEAGTFDENWNNGYRVEYDFDYKGTYEQDLDASLIPEKSLKVQISSRNTKRYISCPSTGVGKSYDINPDPEMAGDNNFIFGNYVTGANYKPFSAMFAINDKTSKKPIGTLIYEFPAPEGYYSVGEQIYKFNNSFYADIDFEKLNITLNDGSTVLFNSSTMEVDPFNCVLFNIFHAVSEFGEAYKPDLSTNYKVSTGESLKINISKIYEQEEFIQVEYLGYSTFLGYTSVNLKITRGGDDLFKELNPSSYARYEKEINNGSVHIRYRVDSLKQSLYRYKLKGDDNLYFAPLNTPIKQFELGSQTGEYALLFKNSDMGESFSPDKLERLDLMSAYITIDLTKNQTGPIARTGVSTRFGAIAMQPEGAVGGSFNADLFVTIFSVCFVLGYVVIAALLFLWWKHHFRNDEFHRLNPKKFIKTASIGLLCLTIVALAIVFICLRVTTFANAVVVFNPVDPFVIAFGALSIIIIGYLIKFLWTRGKAASVRKKAKKLKLDQDKVEDGTN